MSQMFFDRKLAAATVGMNMEWTLRDFKYSCPVLEHHLRCTLCRDLGELAFSGVIGEFSDRPVPPRCLKCLPHWFLLIMPSAAWLQIICYCWKSSDS
ncbi:uncharacterized protein LOC107401216 isoform X3 [Peromyscus maniculatus bairdii]|uniref:uncharacterized protein LOC107401216 isoform X3 n=1 Tax=Peromyscus maniculatus bairdii TaxID=230844 RepID=UPI003FD5B9E1